MAIDREGNLYDPCGGEPVVDNTTQPKVKKMGFTFDELEKVLQEQQYQQNLSRYGLKDGENVDIPIYTDFIEASQKIGLYHIPINVEYDMENTVM